MSTSTSLNNQSILEVKSKYDAEFRRFGLNRASISRFEEFYQLLERLHGLNGIQFNICYTDKDGDLLPINNDNNLARVLNVTIGILRLIIQRKGECYNNYPNYDPNGYGSNMSGFGGTGSGNYSNTSTSYRAANLITQIKSLKDLSTTLTSHHSSNAKPFVISYPEDFRPVSAIIDVDILPDTYRRVRLHKHKSSKPLGFYIRDGRSLRVTPHGVEQVPGIFISRLMPGGLAESTGLLSVNDEVIEVNGIEVAGKTLDQVTDMMVANSSNLIITVKPTNQRYNLNRSNNTTNNSTTNTTMNPNNSLAATNKQLKTSTSSTSSNNSTTNNNNSINNNNKLNTSNLNNTTFNNSFNSRTSLKNSSKGVANSNSQSKGQLTSNPIVSDSQTALLNNTTGISGAGSSVSSVNSSFSSSNQATTNQNSKYNNNKENQQLVADSGQITIDFNANDSTSLRQTTKQLNLNLDESDNLDDDDDDEEILHDATANTNTNSPNAAANSSGLDLDNSDEKILTL